MLLESNEVKRNITTGVIKKENELVGDTTHYHACSGFETVHYTNDNGKEHKKSQSKLTKNCRCEDRDNCEHQWEPADDGAGTIDERILQTVPIHNNLRLSALLQHNQLPPALYQTKVL
ncbi:hypothetical protein MBAV_000206 [Candidatus Magnetobacterium bavaricum]|uniref:Uncharacterized protein n=1 Tax=Candidatus Magnetobacterium bavaricum TaxID=29290 RepID=A0A0F3H0H8_9BACT|nr:hypothetical protein MBAV_000206 [Candidatus Magnetobacterium bavaricum]